MTDYRNIILLVVAVLNLLLGVIIYFRNTKAPLNFYFLLMLLCAAFWSSALIGYSLNFSNQYYKTIFI